ncbi:MAG TPA: RDD family protein [Candidatus Nanoarchaeia archaeon]|nr:RDD family protein [Candidatus Nanoarchaeia archaeon]
MARAKKTQTAEYAGFWMRLAAAFIDGMIINGMLMLAVALIALPVGLVTDFVVALITGYIALFPLAIIIPWLYEAIMTSSPKQATYGKMALGIKITDTAGNRISFLRATGRHFGKYISHMAVYIGYIMIAFTAKKQGLHDMMAGTLVVKSK